MSRFSLSREPAAWIGFFSAAIALVALFGVHLPDGLDAAVAVAVTAGSALVIRSQVTPAKGAVRVDTDTEVNVTATTGNRQVQRRFVDGRQVYSSAVIQTASYADPAEVAAKSRADLATKKPAKKAAKATKQAKKRP